MRIKQTWRAVKHHLQRTANPEWERQVREPRHRRGRRWPLGKLLRALWAGAVSGARNLREVEALTERMGRRTPDTTLSDLLEKLSAKDFNKLHVTQIREALRAKELAPTTIPFHMVAGDGKTIWVGKERVNKYCQESTLENGQKRYSMRVQRAVWVSGLTKLCILQRPIPAEQSEMSAFPEFFKELRKHYGRSELLSVISYDAGVISEENARMINDAGIGYLLGLKNPQKELVWEAERVLGQRKKADAETPWERYNGRRIRRLLFRTTEMAGYHGWNHLREVWRVRQETEYRGKLKVEERYFVTNLVPGMTKGDIPLRMVRAHWAIENASNWTMDMMWEEDDCPWCSRALEVVSLLRILAYNVVTRLKTRRLKSAENRQRPWRNVLQLIEDVLVNQGFDLFLGQESYAEAVVAFA